MTDYMEVPNHHLLGANHIAFVQVSLFDTRAEALAAFNREVRQLEMVEQCHMIAGGFNIDLRRNGKRQGMIRMVGVIPTAQSGHPKQYGGQSSRLLRYQSH